jgi:tRNA(fMet)-specific endonuclease VapC
MNRYLLDSNVLMHVVNRARGFGFIEARLLQAKADTVLVSAVTVWEIFRAAEKGKVPGKAAAAALALLSEFKVVPLTREAAALGGSICARLAKIGLTIGERDSMIAGSAVAHGFTMVTDNIGEFGRIPGLRLENWRVNPI